MLSYEIVMADKPTQIKEWATNNTALKTEPANSFKKTGFPVSQPPVNFVNWVLFNIYKWIDYFDSNISGTGGQGGFTYTHNSTTPRIELPFVLSSGTNALTQIEVLKKKTASVGGVSVTPNSGTGTVDAGTTSLGSPSALTYNSGPFTAPNNETVNGTGASFSISLRIITVSGEQYIDTNNTDIIYRWPNSPEVLSAVETDNDILSFRLSYYTMKISDGSFIDLTITTRGSALTLLPYILSNNTLYLIGANSESEMSSGNCIIWQLPSSMIQSFYNPSDSNYRYHQIVDPHADNVNRDSCSNLQKS